MSEQTIPQIADQLYSAVEELYKADLALKEAIAARGRAELRRHEADIALARLVPWSAEAQHINILLSPLDDVLVTIAGEPAEGGNDCKVAPLRRILDLARIKRDRSEADTAADDLPD